MRPVRRALILVLALASLLGLAATYLLTAQVMEADTAMTGAEAIFATLVFAALGVGLAAFAIVGVLLVWRREHPMGWVFGAVGAGLGIGFAASEHIYAAEQVGFPVIMAVAWVSNWLLIPTLAGGLVALLLLFPTGRLPTPRWRPVGWFFALDLAVLVAARMFHPRLQDAGGMLNPLPITLPLDTAESAALVAERLMALALMAGLAAIARRFRAAHGVERQQLKWFTFAATITAAGFGSLLVASAVPALEPIGNVGWPVGMVGLSSIPIAAGIAILRYRLYDIDLLINRTLVYGLLTVTLGAVYVGSVILLQGVLSGFTGGNSLAVAASTLAVAALFQPVRRRIQSAVDQRFYRSRYDAARTLEAFAGRLRHEVDLTHLTDELRGVVAETLRPASVSVWLRRGGVE